ncbi:myogenesis-regulating glycosidase-like isoform X3 [Palaemon carinicauda]|uniref:myogenesis-regulating glycosidase-like isoform X3 n=1 Tax=Palaemon carinicauda TaxID=392227 RepID=UPI0035B61123
MTSPGGLYAIILALRILSVLANGSLVMQMESEYNAIRVEDNILYFTHPKGKASVFLGLTSPGNTYPIQWKEGMNCTDSKGACLRIDQDEHCYRITWTTQFLSELKDCLTLDGHWYGGGEQISQPWPIEKVPRTETAYVTADMLQNRELWYGGVSEAYWISSQGIALKVAEETPLFLSLPDKDGDGKADLLCLRAARELPYQPSPHLPLTLSYSLCSGDNVKEVHERTYPKFFRFPKGIPDLRMFSDPIWSTWAEYKENVDEQRVRDLASGILRSGFNNSQIEIDDNWETCYGDLTFNPGKFQDPKRLIEELRDKGFRVTLWIHPFVNEECQSFAEGDKQGYFIKDEMGITQITSWWQGSRAGLIDFSNPEAVSWWTQKLLDLQESTGVDSFKFDAGETSWMPKSYVLRNTDQCFWPNVYSKKFVGGLTKFGRMIETRVGRGTQEYPVFVRMLDKDSVWSEENGLRTLVPSLLHFGVMGYPFVLPDMIGGNSYDQQPSEELFLRWAQANALMPAMQFSILPWRYGVESSYWGMKFW